MNLEAEIRRLRARLGAKAILVRFERNGFMAAAEFWDGPLGHNLPPVTRELSGGETIEGAISASHYWCDGVIRDEQRDFLREHLVGMG